MTVIIFLLGIGALLLSHPILGIILIVVSFIMYLVETPKLERK